jgi:DNA-binding XRE family transcriptional regulator
MTQESLGRKVNLTRTSIINIEKGRQQIQLRTLVEIARELNIQPSDLIPTDDTLQLQLNAKPAKGRAWIMRSAKLPNAGG